MELGSEEANGKVWGREEEGDGRHGRAPRKESIFPNYVCKDII